MLYIRQVYTFILEIEIEKIAISILNICENYSESDI